jgi:hypothetical protein
VGVGDAAGGLAEQRRGDARGAPSRDHPGVQLAWHYLPAGVVVGVGNVDAELA